MKLRIAYTLFLAVSMHVRENIVLHENGPWRKKRLWTADLYNINILLIQSVMNLGSINV